ncbi:NADH-quinone oxidoreductase subunit N [bacterium]|nr:NADH-quinone oxidoreductase subunit N [candidate division CSSED10-310 bacterium]
MDALLIPDFDYLAAVPIALPAIFALLVLIWDLVMGSREENELYYLTFSGLAITGLTLLLMYDRDVPPLGRFLCIDRFAIVAGLICILAGVLTLLIAAEYLKREGLAVAEFLALLLLSTSGMLVLASATELVTLFVGLELMALPVYLLTAYHFKRYLSTEAGMKYFLLGIMSTAFLLMSLSLMYGMTGSTDVSVIIHEIERTGLISSPALALAAVLFLVAFSFKVSVFPFHIWTPDAYQGAPSPVTAFMSVAPKTAALAAMIRILVTVLPGISDLWILLLSIMAACTMVFGNVVAVVQDNLKRLLAYSTIAHAGYLMIGLVAYSTTPDLDGLPDGISAILFYMFAYAFANIGAFAVIILMGREGQTGSKIEDYDGLGTRHPFAAAAMTLFMLSLTGIPITAGFVGKVYLFGAAIKAGPPLLWLAVVGILTSVISLFYYMKIVLRMYASEPRETTPLIAGGALLTAIAVCAGGVILLGIFPNIILNMARESVRLLML